MPPQDQNPKPQNAPGTNPFIQSDSSAVVPAPPPVYPAVPPVVGNAAPSTPAIPKPTLPLPPMPPAPSAPPLAPSPLPTAEPMRPVVSIPPQPPPAPDANATVSTISPTQGGFPKKILLIIFLILGLLTLVIVFVRFALPRLQEGVLGPSEVELTWWGLWEDESLVAPLIQEYQQAHPNVKITYSAQSKQDYRERLTSSLAQGNGPDMFRFHNTWVPMLASELSIMPNDVMTPQEFAQTYYPTAVSDLTHSSGIVGIPLEYDGLGLFINEDIFTTYSKTPPKTWNDLRDIAIDLTIKDEKGIIQQAGAAIGRTENVDHWQEILALMLIQNGAKPDRPTGELAEGALKFYTSLARSYGVWDDKLPPSTIMFSSGKLAMYFGPSWRVFEIMEQNPQLRFRVIPVPQLPKVDPSEPDITLSTYWVEGVWERSPNKAEAWKFMQFISSKESLQKLYENASAVRKFGEPYPRTDMRDLMTADPILGGFMALAPTAKSSYLVSRTYDGATGINSSISKYYEDAVNKVVRGQANATDALQVVATGVKQVLGQYGVSIR